jgi:hypothetical protein
VRQHVSHPDCRATHNVETLLGSKPLKQEWIDVMMGHKFEKKGQARKSIGVLIYLHGLEMAVLQQTAYAVEYPAHLCPTLLLRRLRGEVPWEYDAQPAFGRCPVTAGKAPGEDCQARAD